MLTMTIRTIIDVVVRILAFLILVILIRLWHGMAATSRGEMVKIGGATAVMLCAMLQHLV